ncbi:hypothetical protein [Vulcanococcus limneticus]|uniref:hypothetical protein n=1 Tax=Vulcanococcus limneticus TaxID=2170428 RepID=UPI00398BD659
MFRVSDSLENRRARIQRSIDDGESAIAFILAAADLERTVRRAIIALAAGPTKEVRETIEKKYKTIGNYEDGWRTLVEVTGRPGLREVVGNWDAVKKAFQTRNEIIHGKRATLSREHVTEKIEVILNATAEVTNFAEKYEVNLMARMNVRRKPADESSS